MKIILSIIIFIIIFSGFIYPFKAYAFDIKNYFNYEIIRGKLGGAEADFLSSNISVQKQEIFQRVNYWLYQRTGVNLLNIWLGASGLLISTLRWVADLFSSLR